MTDRRWPAALTLVAVAVVAVGLALSGVLRSVLLPAPRPTPAATGAEPSEPPPARIALTRPVSIRSGDTLVSALRREGVGARTANDVAAALARSGANLRRVKRENAVLVAWDVDGRPALVTWEPSPWVGYIVTPTEAAWRAEVAETRPDVHVAAVTGDVRRSLFDAVEDAGESPALVHDLVEIFSSDFDFTADTRPGDRFRVLVEKRYAGEAFVDYGRILAAQYVSAGRVLTGVGWQPRGARWQFFDPAGQSLRKSFLKSPLEFTRITSGFSYARPHPILGGVRPHLAIDYGAPAGTPVRAVADGVVLQAGWDGGNGISVRLRHRAAYETMYNHLSRVAAGVHPGARVRQRQVIGYVGATGLATGPHLDFRVARAGRFVNPIGEKYLPGDPIAAAEKAAFTRRASEVVRQLEASAPL